MTIQHSVFCRKLGDGKVILVTVVDPDSIGLTEEDQKKDIFFVAETSKGNPYNGMRTTISLLPDSKIESNRYVEIVNKNNPDHTVNPTYGEGMTGIARGAYWFIRKVVTVVDMLF